MKIFLSGGGSGIDSAELDRQFALALGTFKPLLYIPIAINEKKHPYSECYKWLSTTFNPLGINEIEMWTEKDLSNRVNSDLKKFSGVYIGGGNTFYLLNELKESGFLKKLEALVRNGVPFYGGSAGAIICGKSIIPALAADPNDVNLKDLNGMNLIKGYDLWCHYVRDMDKEILKYTKEFGLKIIALSENSGLYVTDNNIKVIGPGSAYLSLGRLTEVKPQNSIKWSI